MHDPTTLNRQGGDIGTQYRSAIFTHDEEQERIAREVTEKVGKEWYKDKPITTQIVPAGKFWDAEEYHQLYLRKNPDGYECPAQYVVPEVPGMACPIYLVDIMARKANTLISPCSFVRNFPPLSE